MTERYGNNATLALSVAVNTTPAAGTVETWTVTSTAALPQRPGFVRLFSNGEIVTAVTPALSGTTISVTRGVEGQVTTHAIGSALEVAPVTALLLDGTRRPIARRVTINATPWTYTLVAEDAFRRVEVNFSAAGSVVVPGNVFDANDEVQLLWYGVGQPTITAGSGLSALKSEDAMTKLRVRYSSAVLIFVSPTEAILAGSLAV